MPRKTFANGFPLPASDLNTYLMDQSVQTYADATARTAALATPVEGQMSYLADTNTAYVYDGSSWNAVVDAKNYGTVLPNGAAGRNKVINGGFDIWQRGTSIATNGAIYAADRFMFYRSAFATGGTFSRQTAGLTGFQYAARVQRDSGNTGTGNLFVDHNLETAEAIKLAGQTVTMSFYARAGANYSSASNALALTAWTGTGTDQRIVSGFTGQTTVATQSYTLTTSWQRFTLQATLGSTTTGFAMEFAYAPTGTAGAADYFEVTGVQLESGSVATPFSRAGGTLQGELAACQRYYYRQIVDSNIYRRFSVPSPAGSTTTVNAHVVPAVTMRVAPTSVEFNALHVYDGLNAIAVSNIILDAVSKDLVALGVTSSGLTQFRPYALMSNGNTASYLGLNAEL